MTVIVIASPDHETQKYWSDTLAPIYSVTLCSQWEMLLRRVRSKAPGLIVVDSALISDRFSQKVSLLQQSCPESKILLIGQGCDENVQIESFRLGVAGYLEADVKPALLSKAVDKLLKGEVWIGRHAASALLDNLRERTLRKAKGMDAKTLSSLTPRELEITKRVCGGESNKRIANHLDITERTVKAHLSSVFRKLEVVDRLQLAVYLKDLNF